jgi:hypothetical protein
LPECIVLSVAAHLLAQVPLLAHALWPMLLAILASFCGTGGAGGEPVVVAVPTDPGAMGKVASLPGPPGPDQGMPPSAPREIEIEYEPTPPPAAAAPTGLVPEAPAAQTKKPAPSVPHASAPPSTASAPRLVSKPGKHGNRGAAIASCSVALQAAAETVPLDGGFVAEAELELVDALIDDFRGLDADGSGFATRREILAYGARDATLLADELDALMP